MHILAFVGLLVAAWIADWVWVTKIWPDGVHGLVGVLDSELEQMGQMACWCGDLKKLAVGTGNALYHSVFGWTGIEGMLGRMALGGPLSVPDSMIRSLLLDHSHLIQTIMVGTQLFGAKAAYLLAAAPAVLLIGVVGLVDGLGLRARQRVSGRSGSAARYHWWKLAGFALMLANGCVVLAIPVTDFSTIFRGFGLEVCAYAVSRKLVHLQR